MAIGIKTGGRKKGSANVKTREIADQAAQAGVTPLEYMLKVMADENSDTRRRDDMAKAAAPYMHPRLQSTEVSGKGGGAIILNITSDDASVL